MTSLATANAWRMMVIPMNLIEKEVPVSSFRHKPSVVYDYIKAAGHVVIFTRRGKREAAIMSIDTYCWLTRLAERSKIDENND